MNIPKKVTKQQVLMHMQIGIREVNLGQILSWVRISKEYKLVQLEY